MGEKKNKDKYPLILGVYSSEKEASTGAGARTVTSRQLIYWYVRQTGEDEFELQPLTANYLPSGIIRVMNLEQFSALKPEPSYYTKITLPVLESLREKIERGEKYYDKGLFSAAEREFLEAVKVDESNVRANYGLGMVYSDHGDYDKMRSVLNVLLGLDVTFHEEHRQRFNNLGLNMRRSGFVDQALDFYLRALELNDRDEHLHFNLARAYFEKPDYPKCREHLRTALELKPDFKEALLFRNYLEENAPETLE
jgi:tetratricopeptide (TPR) repeat protein